MFHRIITLLAAGFFASLAACGQAATGTIQDVQHVVILMQENRSFDHYFGSLAGVRGFGDPNVLMLQNGHSDFYQPGPGGYVLPFHVTAECINDVDHDEASGLEDWNSGNWDQWVSEEGAAAMTYYTRTNLPFYYALADAYTLCDANHCSFFGPTFPNRLYLFTGMIDPRHTGGGPALSNFVPFSGYTWTTYPERLQAAGVNWKVYRPNGDWFGDALQWFAQYKNAAPGNPLYDRGMATVNNVVAAFKHDVTNNTLPSVSWIIPTFDVSEHAAFSPDNGEIFVKQLLDALASNPAVYNSTAFIITYDEAGGFFDHVPPPVAPPGTADEFVHGAPLGLGVRVPMIIVSPWTHGGRVCSQVFDHTSVIRFLETWTGVPEPNISVWRRQVCGDLTSAFDFANPNTNYPSLPNIAPVSVSPITPAPPNPQTFPPRETGTKLAMPLPYQPDATSFIDYAARRLYITMTNAGAASVHFAIYPNAYPVDNPRQYDVGPTNSLRDFFPVPLPGSGRYDLTCYGPNGFQRRFAGNINSNYNQVEVTSSVDANAGSITLAMQNSTDTDVNFTITDGFGLGGPWTNTVPSGGTGTNTFLPVNGNHGWYDFIVTADGGDWFLRRFAGHIETGSSTPTANSSSIPILIIPPTTNALPALKPKPFVLPNVIGQTPNTNSPTIFCTTYYTNFVLIYPAWASNYVIESSPSMQTWTPITPTPNSLGNFSNYIVVPLPITESRAYFRLRQ